MIGLWFNSLPFSKGIWKISGELFNLLSQGLHV
jgi:hypothetical protein